MAWIRAGDILLDLRVELSTLQERIKFKSRDVLTRVDRLLDSYQASVSFSRQARAYSPEIDLRYAVLGQNFRLIII